MQIPMILSLYYRRSSMNLKPNSDAGLKPDKSPFLNLEIKPNLVVARIFRIGLGQASPHCPLILALRLNLRVKIPRLFNKKLKILLVKDTYREHLFHKLEFCW